ncbi:DUF4179 domain-containing protein [Virgibacillus kekensis]|uniref:DUF4179 domain-containing protein n=1 Tax=Virgibacillus kekensis TaxID=202261 RepID=A0ABV9DH59_9BACI
MYEKEEEKLKEYKNIHDDVPLPLEAIDEAIMTGFQKAKFTHKRKKRQKKWMLSAVLAAIIVLSFVTGIRVSPVFAQYVTGIPGMEKIVELIRDDKGMMAAVKNDYYQEIRASAEKDGLKVTIDGAIADTNGIVLFYTLETDEKQKDIMINDLELTSAVDEKLDFAHISFGAPHESEEGKKSYSGTVEFFFDKPYESREFVIDLKVQGESVGGEFSIDFKLKKELRHKVTYELNQTVSMEGQKITFKKATVYPTRVAVHLEMHPSNTKEILAFENLRLVDGSGEAWSKINNGVVGSSISDDEKIIYLQSNYFRNAEELSLVVSRAQAVDRDKSKLLLDLKNEKILMQPAGNKLRNLEVNGNKVSVELHTKERFNYGIFGPILDANGERVKSRTEFSYMASPGKSFEEIGFNMEGTNIASPITVELTWYPQWIKEEVRVKIK